MAKTTKKSRYHDIDTSIEDNREYTTVDTISAEEEIAVIEHKDGRNSAKAPAYSNTPGRIYAILNAAKEVRQIAFYGDNRDLVATIDMPNDHKGYPHVNNWAYKFHKDDWVMVRVSERTEDQFTEREKMALRAVQKYIRDKE